MPMFQVQFFHGAGQPLGEPQRFEASSLQAAIEMHCSDLIRGGRNADLRAMIWEAKPLTEKIMFFRNTRKFMPLERSTLIYRSL